MVIKQIHHKIQARRSLPQLPAALFLALAISQTMTAAADPVTISPQDPTSVARGIAEAYKAGQKKIVIPPGEYRLPRLEESPWHLRFEDLKDFEIDATGATFIFTGRDRRAILFNYCQNVTLRGLTLMRDIPPFSQGKIADIAPDRSYVDIKVDAGYPTDLDDLRYFPRIPVFNVYQKGTRQLKPLVPDIYLAGIERQGPDTFRFRTRGRVDERIPLAVGDPIAWRGPSGSDMASWCCSGMRFENVTIRNGTGLAIHEMAGEGGNVYKNCVITYAQPPAGATELPLLACGTDGFHSGSVRKGPTLENCLFEGLDDDSVNIHGGYAMVMEVSGNRAVLDARAFHRGARTPIPFAEPGDEIRIYDNRFALASNAKMVSLRRLENYQPKEFPILSRYYKDRSKAEYWEVTLDHPVTGEPGGMATNADMTGSHFVIRNCTFRNSRAHGIFIRASDGLIENNTIEGIVMGGIVIAPEFLSWNEADFAFNITIRGNTIRRVGLGSQPWNSGITVAAFEEGQFIPLPGGHHNILIENNLFEQNRGPNVVITSASDVRLINNRFVSPMDAPAFRVEKFGTNTNALIWMRNSEKVSLKGNVIQKPGDYMKTVVDRDNSVQADIPKNGITFKR